MPARHLCLLALLLLAPAALGAVRVDLNQDNDRKDALTQGWENWRIKDGPSASQKFGDVTVTLRAVGNGATLAGVMWKGGFDTGATMASDGVSLKGDGATLEIVLSGLSPGRHSLVTYHNVVAEGATGTIAVAAGSATAKVTPTRKTKGDEDAAAAFVTFDAEAGKDVVITVKAEGKTSLIINGFELDTADPARRANKPSPAEDDEHAPENAVLTWAAPKAAATHRLYLGTSAESVGAATTSSPEFKGNLKEAKFQTQGLNAFTDYFWRVDEVGADKSVTPGRVWRFRVRRLAFPGAEGYGRFARGGRAGRVIEVTNLEDSGPGSLREAIDAEGPRTIVFRVGGTIQLKDKLVIRNPYVTVAGQTAPGDGICIRGATFGNYATHDTIIRYVRVRVGDESGKTFDGMGFASTDHAIIDHCSISWTIDESVSSRGGKNITFQRNIIAEPLNMSVHSHYVGTGKGHSFAGSISGDIGSFHHNLLANAAGRNWSLAGGLTQSGKFAGYLDLRNNVVYNWEHRTNDGGVKKLNLVGNDYIPGPASRVFHLCIVEMELKVPGDLQQYYIAGNVMEGYPQYNPDNWKNGGIKDPRGDAKVMKLDQPFCPSYITEQSPKDAYKSVMADVGCNRPKYDAVDERVIKDVLRRGATFKGSKTGIPGIIDSQKDVGGWPDLKGGDAPADTDHDGMPDAWEKAHKLNPDDPQDGAKDSGDGYTNLETYLNDIVKPRR